MAIVVTMILQLLGNDALLYTTLCQKQNGHYAVDIQNSFLCAKSVYIVRQIAETFVYNGVVFSKPAVAQSKIAKYATNLKSEPMAIQFSDVYIHHLASMG